jgi:predicted nucleotidyltransferase
VIDKVILEIKKTAGRYNIHKIVLFGSRAKGDYSHGSDYDIAVFADALSVFDKAAFSADIEEIETLKKIDVVFIDDHISEDLMKNIKRDGVTIYE